MEGVFTCARQVATHPLLGQADMSYEFRQMHLPKNMEITWQFSPPGVWFEIKHLMMSTFFLFFLIENSFLSWNTCPFRFCSLCAPTIFLFYIYNFQKCVCLYMRDLVTSRSIYFNCLKSLSGNCKSLHGFTFNWQGH